MKLTISVLKADVGSIGGHTKPSQRMMDATEQAVADAISSGLLIDGYVGHTGDDICMTTTHTRGPNDDDVHQFAWTTFLKATDIARQYGLVRRRPGPAGRCPLRQHPRRRPRRS